MRRLLTINQFAERLSITSSCVRRWILEHRISVIKLGRLVRISETEVERLVTEGLRPARQASRTSRDQESSE
jgi:excisionase family DNA binding protein